jgi:hypothetical protein
MTPPNPDTWAVMLIRRLDGKAEPYFGYRACAVRSTVAHLLVLCEVAGVAWLELKTRKEADDLLKQAQKLWL